MPKGTVKKYDSDIGRHFGKRDLERLGLFVEMGYMNGKGYVSPFTAQKDVRVKGRQLYPGYPKSKCGTQDGYFDDKFSRIFEKEAYTNMFKLQMKAALESAKKNTSKSAFVVPGPSKQHSSPGDYFGTFGGKVEAFSPELKRKPTYVKQAPNIQTNPGKKGDSGYADITLSKYPEHSVVVVRQEPLRNGPSILKTGT
ncbi:cilia-and flagella-associated protein 96-like isoform X2 [Periplaneta americana]|uniref:cilia-and flagella-associated protein 96-like isoform X2 n=1 Tax=Periplaneta americana TaxID=6978 RepID=UPI0037E79450